MKATTRAVILAVVAAAAVAAVVLRSHNLKTPENSGGEAAAATQAALPRLVDLGATKCIPCKAMAPILEELKAEYAGRMRVEFIDVWETKGASDQYKVEMIPTQIFYGVDGRELFRHTGFYSKEDILAKWKELGVNLGK